MSEQDVKDWTEYYMAGGELEDDVMQEILRMALAHARDQESASLA